MKIVPTYLRNTEIHRSRWIILSITDHTQIESKHMRNIMNGRSYRGANANSDHVLISTKIKEG